MTQHPSFGGPWTQEKLEILRRYLDAYTTALKNQPFDLWYIDAFAGSGWYRDQGVDPSSAYRDFDELRQGSARIALEIENKKFDRLIYIEKNHAFLESLNGLQEENPHRSIEPIIGDANEELPIICDTMRASERAVVFLDPYATEVDWTTVEAIARTKKIDCWILFPLSALSRMMDNDARPTEPLARHLDRVFGGREHWETLYRQETQHTLFGDVEVVRRESQSQIAALYRERLQTVFERVATQTRQLTNSLDVPMFELIFAAGNQRGAPIAVNIADQILKRW